MGLRWACLSRRNNRPIEAISSTTAAAASMSPVDTAQPSSERCTKSQMMMASAKTRRKVH